MDQSNQPVPIWFTLTLSLVAVIGFLDATYLTINHIVFGSTPCTLLEGCEIVTSSVYSTIFGVPVALFGAIFYLIVLLLSLWYLDSRQPWALLVISYLSVPALLAAVVFVGLQAFVLKAFCLYCLISALTSTIIFILGMSYLVLFRKA
jgi:uncharacterized membrane protein